MVGSSLNMETSASTPSLLLLEQLMDNTEGGPHLKLYPSSRSSLPSLSPDTNGRSKWPQTLLQNLLRSSSRRGRREAAAAEGGIPPDAPPVTRRIWCDSEECLSGPFIKIQRFPQNGQCQKCGQVMKDVVTNTESAQNRSLGDDDGVGSQEDVVRDTGQSDQSIEEAMQRVVCRPKKNSNTNKVSFEEQSSRRRSLPTALDWWSDRVLKRQSSNIKDNVRKSWCPDDDDPSPVVGPRSVSDQAIHEKFIGASKTSINAIKQGHHKDKASSQLTLSDNGGWFRAKKELKHVSKSTPNLSYPSTQVDKLESARLAAWWEESPFPVRSQRFTFRSHSSGQKVVLRKGHSSYEVSAKGKRRQSTNLADLEDLMGAVSGSEEETETDGEDHASRSFLLPYQALQEEMDARSGNFNQSNATNSIPAINIEPSIDQRTPQRSSRSSLSYHLMPKTQETLSRSTPHINGSVSVSNKWSYSSPSLETVIHSQFLRNTSLTSLQQQHQHQQNQHKSFLPVEGLGTPKRLQSARRSGTKHKDLLRHSWGGRPNPLSTSMLKLTKGERSSWMAVVTELPVILEDKSKEKDKELGSLFKPEGSNASFADPAMQYHREN